MARAAGRQAVGAAAETKGGGGAAVEPVEAGKIADVGQAQGEGVVAAAADVEGLDGVEAGASHIGQVEAEASAIEGDRVDAATTIDPGQLAAVATGAEGIGEGCEVGSVEHKAIVAHAADQHIGAAIACDRVVAGIAREGFAGASAADGVGVGAAELVKGRQGGGPSG